MTDKDVEKISDLLSLNRFISNQDNMKNITYMTEIPENCKEMPCILGIDEAGRGPVLGPLVYGISFCPIDKKKILEDLGCADSKQLTEEKREIIFNDINQKEYSTENLGWAVEIISPHTISTSMYRRCKYSLNEISMDSAIGLIQQAIKAEVNIKEVYVDTVGPPEKYKEKLSKIFPSFEITVAKKADSTYPIVSAASICAKVVRDHALQVWKFREGLQLTREEFGSGYPNDPMTKTFLAENIDLVFGYPRLVRFSWSTAETALEGKAFAITFEDEEDKNNARGKSKPAKRPITTFFKDNNKKTAREMDNFYKERFLNRSKDF